MPKKNWESTRTWPNDHIILDAETLGSLADTTPVPIQPFFFIYKLIRSYILFHLKYKRGFLRFQISAPCKTFPGMGQLCEQRLAAFNGFAGKCPSGDQHWRALGGTVKRSTQSGALELLFGDRKAQYWTDQRDQQTGGSELLHLETRKLPAFSFWFRQLRRLEVVVS